MSGAAWELDPAELSVGTVDVIHERERQWREEARSLDGDIAANPNGELAKAAACYALFAAGWSRNAILDLGIWPEGWGNDWFKASEDDRRRALVKAGALVIADLDRADTIKLRDCASLGIDQRPQANGEIRQKTTSEGYGDLLPCPFCGGAAAFEIGKTGDDKDWHYVGCEECSAMGPTVDYADHGIAIREALAKGWNARIITQGDQRRFSEYLANMAATEAAKIDQLRQHGDGGMVATAQDLAFGCLVVSAHLAALADGENGE